MDMNKMKKKQRTNAINIENNSASYFPDINGNNNTNKNKKFN